MCIQVLRPDEFQCVVTRNEPENRLIGDGLQFGPVLRAGDRVEVRWPDETTSVHSVQTRIEGTDDAGWRSRAFVDVVFRGVEGTVPLDGATVRMAPAPVREFDSRGQSMPAVHK